MENRQLSEINDEKNRKTDRHECVSPLIEGFFSVLQSTFQLTCGSPNKQMNIPYKVNFTRTKMPIRNIKKFNMTWFSLRCRIHKSID